MAGNRSFKDYVAERFYNEMFATVQSYISDNYDNLDLRLYRVQNIGGIELSDVEVKFVSVNDLPDMKIEFDVAIEAGFEVRESNDHGLWPECRRNGGDPFGQLIDKEIPW